MKFLFGALAENQVRFFIEVGLALRQQGHEVRLLLFHEPSEAVCRAAGIPGDTIYGHLPAEPESDAVIERELQQKLGVQAGFLLSHEKRSFGLYDTRRQSRKLWGYLRAMESISARLGSLADWIVVQELGGFVANLAMFEWAKKANLPHYFIEPSLFRGRFFLNLNTFSAPVVALRPGAPAVPEAATYIEQTLAARAIVIPKKDSGHFRKPAAKLVDRRNLRRLHEKIWEKYVLKKREEFSAPVMHAWRHVAMAVRAFWFRRRYAPGIPAGPFVYFPLHVPWDVVLTLRSPACLDQFALIDHVARVLPLGCKLAIKEHPALVGAVGLRDVREVMLKNDNLLFLPPETNTFDIVQRAALVVTVNSKVGAEAIMLGRPVLCLGDAFYKNAPGVINAMPDDNLREIIAQLLQTPPPARSNMSFFSAAWDQTYPGEIYDCSEANAAGFATALARVARRGQ